MGGGYSTISSSFADGYPLTNQSLRCETELSEPRCKPPTRHPVGGGGGRLRFGELSKRDVRMTCSRVAELLYFLPEFLLPFFACLRLKRTKRPTVGALQSADVQGALVHPEVEPEASCGDQHSSEEDGESGLAPPPKTRYSRFKCCIVRASPF